MEPQSAVSELRAVPKKVILVALYLFAFLAVEPTLRVGEGRLPIFAPPNTEYVNGVLPTFSFSPAFPVFTDIQSLVLMLVVPFALFYWIAWRDGVNPLRNLSRLLVLVLPCGVAAYLIGEPLGTYVFYNIFSTLTSGASPWSFFVSEYTPQFILSAIGDGTTFLFLAITALAVASFRAPPGPRQPGPPKEPQEEIPISPEIPE